MRRFPSKMKWEALDLSDPENLLEQREGHAACLLQLNDNHFLLIIGGYSANCSPTEIIGVPLSLVDVESDEERQPITAGEVSIIGTSPVVARDGSVLRTIPSMPSVALGFGGIDNEDSYAHLSSSYMLKMEMDNKGAPTAVTAELSLDSIVVPPTRCRPACCLVSSPSRGSNETTTTIKTKKILYDAPGKDVQSEETFAVPANWRLVVFGGEGADGKALNDLWMMEAIPDLGLRWQSVAIESPIVPSPRYLAAFPITSEMTGGGHSIEVLLYGGASNEGGNGVSSSNEVWLLECQTRRHNVLSESSDSCPSTARWLQLTFSGDRAPPRCNGHVGAVIGSGTVFFAGKDFAEGNDNIHLFTHRPCNTEVTGGYCPIPCPFVGEEDKYVNVEEDVGGTGKGVWPHWRYTPALVQWRHLPSNQSSLLFLVCGECRHNDAGTPIYVMKC